jgi:molybdopterin-dependent oxidoreductase alpha subunit
MGSPRILDSDFIAQHTHGFADFAEAARAIMWEDLEHISGLTRNALEAAASGYMKADAVICIYGMGLTQHRAGVENCQMVANLLLLRGNIGKRGAGILPVRGHSNVQGQRTVGITEKPDMVPADKLKAQFGFTIPQQKGRNTVETCEGVIDGSVRAVLHLGGNLVRAVPDHNAVVPAWRRLHLTVQILTKLNRSCLIHGAISYILPCLGRIEIDTQKTGPQIVTTEDSTGCMHASHGVATPASEFLLSEPAIIAGIATATLPPSRLHWNEWIGDYSLIREAIAATYPDIFHDFNARMEQPGGFHRPLAARHREWKTKTGKANFIVPKSLTEDRDMVVSETMRDVLNLMTIRSQGQFNTTIYSDRDRFRGIEGTRMALLMHHNDIDRLRLAEGDVISLETVSKDGVHRQVDNFIVHAYDIPEGCIAGYYPECNPLIPLWHHAERSKVPAAKSIPVRIVKPDNRNSVFE